MKIGSSCCNVTTGIPGAIYCPRSTCRIPMRPENGALKRFVVDQRLLPGDLRLVALQRRKVGIGGLLTDGVQVPGSCPGRS